MFTLIIRTTSADFLDHTNTVLDEKLSGLFPTMEAARGTMKALSMKFFQKKWEEALAALPEELKSLQGPMIIDPYSLPFYREGSKGVTIEYGFESDSAKYQDFLIREIEPAESF